MTAKDITPVTEAAANRQGCYVVDITVTRDNDITVVLDKETGTVGMEDCIAVNDAVLAAFDRDVEDYALTVTSAGLDLPFKDIRQYRKAIGSQVEVLVRDGRKLIATLLACDESGVSLAWSAKEAVDGQKKKVLVEHEETFPYAVLNAVRPHIDFK
jgi:ribosome maturation factor RimP